MRLSFNEISSRFNGISAFGFGASWTPEPNECKVVEDLVTFLENEGLLYAGHEWEHPQDCYESADRVRAEVNSRMQQLRHDMDTYKRMESIRGALRDFRETLRQRGLYQFESKTQMTNDEIRTFDSALVDLRRSVGAQIASLSVACKFDVSDSLDTWLRP